MNTTYTISPFTASMITSDDFPLFLYDIELADERELLRARLQLLQDFVTDRLDAVAAPADVFTQNEAADLCKAIQSIQRIQQRLRELSCE